ncbi:MAG: response regulator transcription factor [Lachnospiraceae bacterium]
MNTSVDILVVEDEEDIRDGLCEILVKGGYNAVGCANMEQAKHYAALPGINMFLLDVMLPDGDGFELCRYIRQQLGLDAPVIFLTAMDDEDSVVKGLELGGNDYLGKPFRRRELIARVGAHLNRYRKQNKADVDTVRYGELRLDTAAGRLYRDNEEILIRRNELKLLSCFMDNPGILISRERLLELMWDIDGEFVDDNTLSVAVSRLRKKIGKYKDNEYIETVRGIGYRWNVRGCEDE